MQPQEEYDRIDYENIVQAAVGLIEILSTGHEPKATVIRPEFDRYTKATRELTRAINRLKFALRNEFTKDNNRPN